MSRGHVKAVCTSAVKGQPKHAVGQAIFEAGHGLVGDAHAGSWHRQVSLLADEQIQTMRDQGLTLAAGAFGENLVTGGIDLHALAVGSRLRVGAQVVLQLTQRGKSCHERCAIYDAVGDCIMPRVGVFARVRRGGTVVAGDSVDADPALNGLRFAVITLSDRGARGEREDRSGPLVQALLQPSLHGKCVEALLLPDDRGRLARELIRLCDDEVCDLVVTTGGTGLSPRDITPEATRDVIDREIPGLAEGMRAAGLAHTPHAMLSRAVAGSRGQALIINLSGSERAVRQQLEAILPVLPHALQVATGIPADCGGG